MALIAAGPGPLRDSLRAFLFTLPGVRDVRLANDTLSALELIAEANPDLALVDASLSGGASPVLRQIKTGSSNSRCLVLADSKQQQRDAAAAGADVALLKGCRAVELFEAIERLLSRQSTE